jgi:hypothetical protein
VLLGALKAVLLLAALVTRLCWWRRSGLNSRVFTLGLAAIVLALLVPSVDAAFDPDKSNHSTGSIAVLATMSLMVFAYGCFSVVALRAIDAFEPRRVLGVAFLVTMIIFVICWAVGDSRRSGSWNILSLDDPADRAFGLTYGIWCALMGVTTVIGTLRALIDGLDGRRRRWGAALLCGAAVFVAILGGVMTAHSSGLITMHADDSTTVDYFIASPALVLLSLSAFL